MEQISIFPIIIGTSHVTALKVAFWTNTIYLTIKEKILVSIIGNLKKTVRIGKRNNNHKTIKKCLFYLPKQWPANKNNFKKPSSEFGNSLKHKSSKYNAKLCRTLFSKNIPVHFCRLFNPFPYCITWVVLRFLFLHINQTEKGII